MNKPVFLPTLLALLLASCGPASSTPQAAARVPMRSTVTLPCKLAKKKSHALPKCVGLSNLPTKQ